MVNKSSLGERTDVYDGNWRIKNGYLVITLTNTTRPKSEPVGRSTQYKLIDITNNAVSFEDEWMGQVVSWTRKNK
jgi:hypothetical protein